MDKKNIISLIEKRMVFHRKHFNRYRKEVNTARRINPASNKSLSQMKYSDEQSGRALVIMDELSLIRDAILGAAE